MTVTNDLSGSPAAEPGQRRFPPRTGGRAGVRPPTYGGHQYIAVAAFAVAVAVAVPALVSSYEGMDTVNRWLVYALAGVGFYWIFGLVGRFAFSQTVMMTVGGFATAWVAGQGGGFWAGMVVAVVASAVVAAVVAGVLYRAHHFYFAIGTLAVTEISLVVFGRREGIANEWLIGAEYPAVFGIELSDDRRLFWLFLAALVLVLLLGVFIERSPLQREIIAARDRELVARTAGVPARKLFFTMFVLGSTVGGVAGALVTSWQASFSVHSFGVDLAIGIFLMVILGGVRSLWGPVLGAAFYVWMPSLLSGFDNYQEVVYGLALLVVIMIFPDGLIGLFHRLRVRLGGAGEPPGRPPLPWARLEAAVRRKVGGSDA